MKSSSPLSWLSRPTFRMTLSQFGAGMVFLTGVGVAFVAYVNSEATVKELTLELFDSHVNYTSARAADYSDSAQASSALTRALIAQGVLPSDPVALADHLVTIVQSNARLSTVGFGTSNGDAVWATRELDGLVQLHHYVEHDSGSPVHRAWEIRGEDRRMIVEEPTTYNASVRPWFKQGLASNGQTWTDPYVFIPENKPGISLAEKVETADGEFLGVLTCDFRLSFLSHALDGLDQGYGTHGVIFDERGYVLGHSDETLTRTQEGENWRIATLDDHHDPLVRRLSEVDLAAIGEQALIEFIYEGEEYALAIHRPKIDDHGALAWWTAVVVPEAALLREVRLHALWSVMVAMVFMLVSVLASVILSRQLTQSFYGFYTELEKVQRLQLEPWDRQPTRILEIERMGEQLEALKSGLTSFARYVPIDLVRELISEGKEARLGGDTREVSILFTDVEGFTTTMENTPPHELLDSLGAYLEQQAGAVRDSGGNVTSFLGDGLMALFGAPVAAEDHALRACRAALLARDRALEMLAEAEASGSPRFPTRIGVNTGEVLVGNVGAPERFDYAAMGDVTNTASRLEGLNKQYGTRILVGERTRELVGEALVFRRLEQVQVKGKSRPLWVFELVGEHAEIEEARCRGYEAYERALSLYSDRAFAEALQGFETCAELLGGDGPSQRMIEACREYLQHPPPDDWDGTRVMQVK